MRIGVFGAGAVGGIVGGLLTQAGRDVTLIDQWPVHVEKMRADGLRVSGTCGEHCVRVRALHLHEAQSIEQPFDVVIIAVKSYDTDWVTQLAATLPRTGRVRRRLPERYQRRPRRCGRGARSHAGMRRPHARGDVRARARDAH